MPRRGTKPQIGPKCRWRGLGEINGDSPQIGAKCRQTTAAPGKAGSRCRLPAQRKLTPRPLQAG